MSGTDYSYTFELRGNALLVTGSGNIMNLTYNFTGIEPTINPTIDQPTLQGLCYVYEYDHRNRLVEKKIPGKDWEHIVYDVLDRPILTQDGNQRVFSNGMPPHWSFTKYDKLGRVVYTGLFRSKLSRKHLQTTIDNTPPANRVLYESRSTVALSSGGNQIYYTNNVYPLSGDLNNVDVLTVTYYDDLLNSRTNGSTLTHSYTVPGNTGAAVAYEQVGTTPEPTSNTKGLATVSEVRVLGTTKWINSASYYDDKARPIHSKSVNDYLVTTDTGTMQLDFMGKVLESLSYHKKGTQAAVVIKDRFSYDHMDRLLEHRQQLNHSAHWERIAKNSYDKMGQLIKKDVGGTPATIAGLQQVDYTYNVRGWLTQINNVQQALGTDLFAFKLDYNNPTAPNATPLYNGNIAATTWATGNDNLKRGYTYQYDALNRIKEATYTGQVFANNTAPGLNGQTEDYSIKNVTYDKNGNIRTLYRMGLYSNYSIPNTFNAVDLVDKLVYSYAPKSNQLQTVIDQADEHASGITNGGFKDKYTVGNKYIYGDLNGNMTRDQNKDMKYIHYNHLNLPTLVMFNSGDRIMYTYDALGTKLAKQVTSGSASTFTYYAGAFIYEQDSAGEKLAFFSQPEGYVEKNGGAFSYVYQHKDHLGSIRLSYKNTSTTGVALQIVEENNYYPFGLKHKGYNNTPIAGQRDHKYGFGGKEEQNELGLDWIDITARNYDPALGRWMNVDPLAEKMPSWSSYIYAFNNPIKYTDPTGMIPEDIIFVNKGNREIGRVLTGSNDHIYVHTGTNTSAANPFTVDQKGNISFKHENTEGANQIYSRYQTILYLNKYNEAVEQIYGIYTSDSESRKIDTRVSMKGLIAVLPKVLSSHHYNVKFDNDFNISASGSMSGVIEYIGTTQLQSYHDGYKKGPYGEGYLSTKTTGMGQDTYTEGWEAVSFKPTSQTGNLTSPNFIGFKNYNDKVKFIQYWNAVKENFVNSLKN